MLAEGAGVCVLVVAGGVLCCDVLPAGGGVNGGVVVVGCWPNSRTSSLLSAVVSSRLSLAFTNIGAGCVCCCARTAGATDAQPNSANVVMNLFN